MRSRQSEVSLLVMALFILGALALSSCGSSSEPNAGYECLEQTLAYSPYIYGTWALHNTSASVVNVNSITVEFSQNATRDEEYPGTINIADSSSGCTDIGTFYMQLEPYDCYRANYYLYTDLSNATCQVSEALSGRFVYELSEDSLSISGEYEVSFIKSVRGE